MLVKTQLAIYFRSVIVFELSCWSSIRVVNSVINLISKQIIYGKMYFLAFVPIFANLSGLRALVSSQPIFIVALIAKWLHLLGLHENEMKICASLPTSYRAPIRP